MKHLEWMTWLIGVGNPLSALLTGPALQRLGAPPHAVRRAQGVGWAVLAVAQVAFLAFGLASGLAGFRIAQPTMLLVAAVNFACWWSLRPPTRPRPPRHPGVWEEESESPWISQRVGLR